MGNFNRDRRPSGGRNFGRRDFRGGDRPMYEATCSNCGKECKVPFRPTNGKPVYCSDCFEKMGDSRHDSPRAEKSDFRSPRPDQNKEQFNALNIKLDKILRILEPKIAAAVVPAETPKDKKTAKKSSSAKKNLTN